MLKLGIIGTNIITDQMLDAAKTTGQYQLTAVYSRTLTRAKEYGEPYGATAFYDSLEDFFDEGDFDVVYIASPNSKHYEQALPGQMEALQEFRPGMDPAEKL